MLHKMFPVNLKLRLRFLTRATLLCASASWLATQAWAIPPLAPPLVKPPAAKPAPALVPAAPSSAESDAVFLNFASWAQRYHTAAANQKTAFVAQGVEVARQRKKTLLALFDSDPERAITWALSWRTRASLPSELAPYLETPVAGCGDFSVLAARVVNPASGAVQVQIMRYSTIKGKVFKTRVYGRRRGLTTKYNISQHGIAFDNILLLHESPIRMLEAGESAPANAVWDNAERNCPFCGALATNDKAVAAQIGDTYYAFDTPEHLQRVEAEIVRRETKVGPTEGSVCDAPLSKLIEEMKRADAKRAAGEDDDTVSRPLDRRDAPFGDPPLANNKK